ncbi:hypothetical protein SeGA_1821 [Salmonella enterica subsp. enterica serovar Gaminara str. A4-567]|nr:hypothetical protein SeGA_1821 [Salmonella enterica subsp. enterica serovar Gaminara str. A4-567]EHC51388.1 hypothetical protein LTSEGIV_1782 [Salmonella enterica subsp. enterica serovar Give str. S5-487]
MANSLLVTVKRRTKKPHFLTGAFAYVDYAEKWTAKLVVPQLAY